MNLILGLFELPHLNLYIQVSIYSNLYIHLWKNRIADQMGNRLKAVAHHGQCNIMNKICKL